MATYSTRSIRETESLAKEFLRAIAPWKPQQKALVVGLSGDLGSGKTAFVKAAAKALGVRATVTSPTFVIEKRYALSARQGKPFSLLVHIDAYRLKGSRDLYVLGWRETIRNPGAVVFIEWPENVRGAIPRDASTIRFQFVDEKTRKIEIKKVKIKSTKQQQRSKKFDL